MDTQRPGEDALLNSEPAAARPVRNLEFKATLLLVFTALLIAGSVFYLLYARGVFQATQTLVLQTDDAEGVVVGMGRTCFAAGFCKTVSAVSTVGKGIGRTVNPFWIFWINHNRGKVKRTAYHIQRGALRFPGFAAIITDVQAGFIVFQFGNGYQVVGGRWCKG